ncbi:unnamed protein product, partial [Ectocarpus sp. 12 AP-2014]
MLLLNVGTRSHSLALMKCDRREREVRVLRPQGIYRGGNTAAHPRTRCGKRVEPCISSAPSKSGRSTAGTFFGRSTKSPGNGRERAGVESWRARMKMLSERQSPSRTH